MSNRAPKKSKSRKPNTATLKQNVKNVSVPLAKTQVVTTVRTVVKPKPHQVRNQLVMSLLASDSFLVNNGNTNVGFLRLNPSNPALFPSLMYEAANYDSYRFTKIRMYYQQLVTVNTSGKIAIAWDPDSQDVLPASRVDIPQYSRSVHTAVYESCSLSIPTDGKWRYVNDSTVVDRKLTDHGQVYVATHSGTPFTERREIGDLYIECDVEFKDPQPTATTIQTGIIDVGGTLTSTGPSFITREMIDISGTDLEIILNIPGTYSFTLVVTCTGAGTFTVGGNSVRVGESRGGYGSGNYFASTVLTTTGVPATARSLRFNGATGIARVQFTIAKCNVRNAFISG